MDTQQLSCMEVWGGNRATFSAFEKAGLDIWLYSRPCGDDASGGDVYYLSSCASGRITRMVLADVSGHGEQVAKVADGLRSLMHRYINTIQPNKLFEELNEDFSRLPEEAGFATSIVNSYFMPTSTLRICNAGHPAPLIRRADADAWERIEIPAEERPRGDMPLGVSAASPYNESDVPVRPDDLVLCYTDGAIEAKDGNGRPLGIDGLRRMLGNLPANEPERLLSELVDNISRFEHGDRHDDDVTLLLYRINNRGIPMSDNLAAPLRWIEGLLASR